MDKYFRAFVSSTWTDLQSERQAVEKALNRVKDTVFAGMEYFGSHPETPKAVSLAEVDGSDLYIGIFAHRYGSGITEAEYRRAQKNNIPSLIYIKDKNTPVLPARIERDPEKAARLEALKQELKEKHTVTFFSSAEMLATRIVADLHNLLAGRPDIEQKESPGGTKYEISITGGQGIVIGDRAQVTQHFGSAASTNTQAAEQPAEEADPFAQKVYQTLVQHFDREELRALCFHLGVEYDDLAGEGRAAKARELVRRMRRFNRLDRLWTEIKKLRPGID